MTQHAGVREMALPAEYDEWVKRLNDKIESRDRSAWEIADAFIEGENKFNELAFAKVNLRKISRHTLTNYANIRRKFPDERKKWDLSISHYDAVKALPEHLQDRLLALCVRIEDSDGKVIQEGMTREELREVIRKGMQTETTPDPITLVGVARNVPGGVLIETEEGAGAFDGLRVSVRVAVYKEKAA